MNPRKTDAPTVAAFGSPFVVDARWLT